MSDILTLNGVEVVKLSTLVDSFCLRQGNTKQKDYYKYLEMGRIVAKEIFRKTKTEWNVVSVAMELDECGDIDIPDDCARLLSISVVDCEGKQHPLGFNPTINTVSLTNAKKCSCNKCNGQNTLCQALDNTTVLYNTIYLQDVPDMPPNPFTQTVFTTMDSEGNLVTKTITPTLDTNGNVIDITTYSTICAMQVDNNGCLCNTEQNRQLLKCHCGYNNPYGGWNGLGMYGNHAYNNGDVPVVYNHYGQWNWDANNNCKIHIRLNNRNRFYFIPSTNINSTTNGIINNDTFVNNYCRYVIVTYQLNMEKAKAEIIIPQYAQKTWDMGMLWEQKVMNPKDGDADGRAYAMFRKMYWQMKGYLNPISITDMLHVQVNPRPF